MMTFPSAFSDAFINQRVDVITGTTTEAQFPSIPAKIVQFHARSTNNGPFYLGVGNTGSSWGLAAGDGTNWISVPTGNLNVFRQSCSSGTFNLLEYWVQW